MDEKLKLRVELLALLKKRPATIDLTKVAWDLNLSKDELILVFDELLKDPN